MDPVNFPISKSPGKNGLPRLVPEKVGGLAAAVGSLAADVGNLVAVAADDSLEAVAAAAGSLELLLRGLELCPDQGLLQGTLG